MTKKSNFPSFQNPINLSGISQISSGLNSYQKHFFDIADPLSGKQAWNLEEHERCAIAGFCISSEEGKKILKKSGLSIKRLSHLQVNELIKKHLTDKNPVSIKTDRFLRKKYDASIKSFFDLDEASFLKKWKERLKTGKFDDLFYIAMTRTDLSQKTVQTICGDQHMASYQHNEQVGALKSELKIAKECLLDVSSQLKQKKEMCRGQIKEIHQLKDQNNQLNTDLQACRNIDKESLNNQLQETQKENRKLQKEIEALKESHIELISKLAKADSKIEKNSAKLLKISALNRKLQREVELLNSFTPSENPCSENPSKRCSPETCEKTVLVVGGMTKIKHLYRDLIEKNGGSFEYHDGHIKGGWLNLENKVCKSDVVLCPVNCNSHGACLKVKELCKKYDKPIQMLPTSSISGISQALNYN